MPAYIALLRAVNVTGNNKLPMAELKSMCEQLGFRKVKTYIASGNVVFLSPKSEVQVKSSLERALEVYAGKTLGVMVRTAAEMAAVSIANPFPDKPANKTLAIFLDHTPPAGALASVTNRASEEISFGVREIYVFYPDGVGLSRLQIPAAKTGTARNMNTVARLAEMAASLK